MSSVFSHIIAGELPAHFVWSDDLCVAFLSNRPLQPGHTLVVPRLEVDDWLDLDPGLLGHLVAVSHTLGRALKHGFRSLRVGVMIAGLEVPHVHIHLVPMRSERDLRLSEASLHTSPEDMDRAAQTIREALADLGLVGEDGKAAAPVPPVVP
jgi:diadenosine tetraphosphate (Ap4A) HIT family hydrolase